MKYLKVFFFLKMQNCIAIPICFSERRHTILALAHLPEDGCVRLQIYDSADSTFEDNTCIRDASAALANLFRATFFLYGKERLVKDYNCDIKVYKVNANPKQTVDGQSCAALVIWRAIHLFHSKEEFVKLMSGIDLTEQEETNARMSLVSSKV